MRKMVYNKSYGGFSISKAAATEMARLGHSGAALALDQQREYGYHGSIYIDEYTTRHDPILVHVVETLGKDSFGDSSDLALKELGDTDHYEIDEFDGKETVKILNLYCDCCKTPRMK